jgi:hypothetical protein
MGSVRIRRKIEQLEFCKVAMILNSNRNDVPVSYIMHCLDPTFINFDQMASEAKAAFRHTADIQSFH